MNVLITGGSRGIGRACVEKFAAEGHNVTFFYHSSDDAAKELCEATGAVAIKCDVSDSTAVSNALAGICAPDVLINNAGICGFCFFDSITDEQWKRMLDINLSGAFYVSREACKPMIAKKSGRIINIGSVWGRVGASCEVVYSASKAGLEGLTRALAKELGPSGITVNCIEPGVIDTEMNSELDEEALCALCDETPLCRIGKTSDVADAVLWLASEKAGFVTGQVIGIDGGFGL